jgi:hypothetical protein
MQDVSDFVNGEIMFAKEPDYLFSQGHPMSTSGRPGLRDILQQHEKQILAEVNACPDIRELTDEFLQNLVKKALVTPINLKIDEKKRKTRTEYFHPSVMPWNRGFRDRHWSGEKYPKKVFAICVPFTGDKELFGYCPNPCDGFTFPRGTVNDGHIEFDVILCDENKGEDVAKEINDNLNHIERFLVRVNEQVREFNAGLPERIKAVFQLKEDRLIKENIAIDAIGIPEMPEPENELSLPSVALKQTKKREPRTVIQNFMVFAQEVNQTYNSVETVTNVQTDLS